MEGLFDHRGLGAAGGVDDDREVGVKTRIRDSNAIGVIDLDLSPAHTV